MLVANETTREPVSPLHTACRWLTRDGRVVVATVIETWGSAPVPVGGQMVVGTDGGFAGSVSGGCIESDVIFAAGEAFDAGKPKVLSFGVDDATAWAAGLPCGGRVRILLERYAGRGDLAFLQRLVALEAARAPAVIATDLTAGTRTLFEPPAAMSFEADQALAQRLSRVHAGPAAEFFLAVLVPAPRLVLIGATHLAQLICRYGEPLGFECVVVDPRSAFASPARFPGTRLILQWPRDALPELGLDAGSALLALAHAGHIDDAALVLAARSPAFYVGALGSRRNHEKRVERLRSAGLSEPEIARIHAPIGLDIGARTPAEIALSVVAEVVLRLRGPKRANPVPAALTCTAP